MMPGLIKSHQNNLIKYMVILFLFIGTFIFLLESPMHIWRDADPGTDQSVFQTVALMMQRGYMPYLDSFDHKGPLIYLINYLGRMIHIRHGIWLFEFAAVFVTFSAIYKIARLRCDRPFSGILVLASAALCFDYFKQGNMTEEYAMPFIAVSLYIYLDYFINRKISSLRLIICGLSLGGVLMLRPNMIAVWVVFSIAVLIDCLRRHQAADIRNFLLFFMTGFCIMVLPFMIWLAANHAFGAFIDEYFYFNMLYSSAQGGASTAVRLNCLSTFLNPAVYHNQILTLLTLTAAAYLCLKKERFLYGTYLLYLFITLLFMCISGHPFNHYGMVLIPAIAFPIAAVYDSFVSRSGGRLTVCLILLPFILGGIALPHWLSALQSVPGTYRTRNEEHHSSLVRTVCSIVEENTSLEDSISVYGNWNIIYILSNRTHATKYSFQQPIGSVLPELKDEYFVELEEELPPVIVLQAGRLDSDMENFLSRHHYTEIWCQETDDAESQPARIFKYENS